MADQVTPQQIEAWVASGNFHAALQALGRPTFQPGDGSWCEWIMIQMHGAHYARLEGGKGEPIEYQPIDRFLEKVSLNKLSVEDHERCWLCYTDLSRLHSETVLPVIYHTLFFDASPMELATALAQRGDDEGLEIMLYHFDHILPKWQLLDCFPVSLSAYQYARFILEDPVMDENWLYQHVQNRYECAGQVLDWIDLLEQHRPDSLLASRWRLFLDEEDLPSGRQVPSLLCSHSDSNELLDVSEGQGHEEERVPNLVNGFHSGESVSSVPSSDVPQDAVLPSILSTNVVSSFIPIVTPIRDHAIVKEELNMSQRTDFSTDPNITNSPPMKPELLICKLVNGDSDTALEKQIDVLNKIPIENHDENILEKLHDDDKQSQRETNFSLQESSNDSDKSFDLTECQPYCNGVHVIPDGAVVVDDVTLPTALDEVEASNQSNVTTALVETDIHDITPDKIMDGEISETVSGFATTGATNICDAVSTRIDKPGLQPGRDFRRDLCGCVNLVQKCIDYTRSQGDEIDKEQLQLGLKDLRKRLKRIRKTNYLPDSTEDSKTDDSSKTENEEIAFLRKRVEELTKVFSQHQTFESDLSLVGEQAVEPFRNYEAEIQSLKDQLNALSNEFEIEKRADTARIRYLRQLLAEKEQLSASPRCTKGSPSTPSLQFLNRTPLRKTEGSPKIPDCSSTEKQLQELCYALECSERQRAQALEDLQLEREFYAEKVRSLQLAFRSMVGKG